MAVDLMAAKPHCKAEKGWVLFCDGLFQLAFYVLFHFNYYIRFKEVSV